MAIAEAGAHEEHHGSDTHGHDGPVDPNVAPTHSDVRRDFSMAQMTVAWALGAIAVVGGVILGLTVINN